MGGREIICDLIKPYPPSICFNSGEPLLLNYAEPPPPSYEDVVNPCQEPEGTNQPSAPPPEDIRHISISPVSRPGYDVGQSLDRERNGEIPIETGSLTS